MSWFIDEANVSRRNETGIGAASSERKYHLRGDGGDKLDDAAARVALAAFVPATIGSDVLMSVGVDEDEKGNGLWNGYARYGPNTIVLVAGQERFSFSTGAGSKHITISKATTRIYSPDYDATGADVSANGFGKLIGVTEDSVEGADIGEGAFEFAVTRAFASGDIDNTYLAALSAAAWHINSGTFRGFGARTVMFMYADGTQRPDGLYELTFHFAARPHLTGLIIGDKSGIAVDAWEIIWTYYKDKKKSFGSNTVIVKYPFATFTERVYDEINFSTLGISTS